MDEQPPSAEIVYLLGAGASKEAGMPLATEITALMLEAVRAEPKRYAHAQALNYVVSAIMAHRGRSGSSPLEIPDIETVVSSVELLAERETVELAPFVQAWDPGVGASENTRDRMDTLGHNVMTEIGRGLGNGLGGRRVGEWLSAFVRAEVGLASGAAYSDLQDYLVRKLLDVLHLKDHADLGYLNPLIDLGRQPGGVSVATLNYDLTIETQAGNQSIDISTGVQDWNATGELSFGEHGIRLYKLHGSMDWTRAESMFSDSYNGTTGEWSPMGVDRMALRPTPPARRDESPFLVFGRREKLRPHGPFLDLRAAFKARLGAARVCVVVGYSFGDEHVNELIAHWINSRDDRRLVVIDPAFPRHLSMNWRANLRERLIYNLVRRTHLTSATETDRIVASRLAVLRTGAGLGLAEVCAASADDLASMQFSE